MSGANRVGDWFLTKQPKLTLDGKYWRWTLVEPGYDETTHEVPEAVFGKLVSGEKHPWLFRSSLDAIIALVNAAKLAFDGGWQPKETCSPCK